MSTILKTGASAAVVATALSMLAVSPAGAATSGDCTASNSLTAPTNSAADLQLLLSDPTVGVICLSGTFTVPIVLSYEHDVTLLGVSNAVLSGAGAGILETTSGAAITVQNLRLTGGTSTTYGGAIAGYGVVVVLDSVFDDNTAGRGGAIAGDEVHVERSTFTGNSATNDGGAIYASAVTAVSTTFTNNTALDGGGAIVAGIVTLDATTFDRNGAQSVAGAVSAGVVDVRNSTFTGNTLAGTTGFAATILANSGGVVQQSTFVDNVIDKPTGGQAIWIGAAASLDLRGNLFIDAAGRTQIAVDGAGAITDLGGNLFTTELATENYFTAAVAAPDPSTLFSIDRAALIGTSTLASNGGAVPTVALPATSAAIDAVPGVSTVLVDARGTARTGLNDAGAFEYAAPAVVVSPPQLAATGSDPALAIGFAALLGLVGAALMRRRARASE